jgi:hypothetical protein
LNFFAVDLKFEIFIFFRVIVGSPIDHGEECVYKIKRRREREIQKIRIGRRGEKTATSLDAFHLPPQVFLSGCLLRV